MPVAASGGYFSEERGRRLIGIIALEAFVPDRRSEIIDPAITSYYNRWPEESRLELGPFQLEELRSRELVLRHIPAPPAVVLDVGGAAGAYAFWLAERGYEVHLMDAVPRLVQTARARNAGIASVSHRLASSHVADARELPREDASAEVVLLLGPLYHLQRADDRSAALGEAARVLRRGGVLLAAGISRCASMLDGLSRELLTDPTFARIAEHDLADGCHQNPTDRTDYFTTAYFHTAR